MNATALLQNLEQAGVSMWVDGDQVRCKGPETALTDEVVSTLKDIKTEIISLLRKTKPTKAKGYGCAGCGNKIYQAAQGWEVREISVDSEWTHEHKPETHWRCESCGTVFQYIGGSNGPQPIN